VLLHRSHDPEALPPLQLHGSERDFTLRLPRLWLEAHPLTGTDLAAEIEYLDAVGIRLQVADDDGNR
jgi:exopolyphosphatase/guanosine-5'-triphosphate,3'-diphosphate pyrophosphatase